MTHYPNFNEMVASSAKAHREERTQQNADYTHACERANQAARILTDQTTQMRLPAKAVEADGTSVTIKHGEERITIDCTDATDAADRLGYIRDTLQAFHDNVQEALKEHPLTYASNAAILDELIRRFTKRYNPHRSIQVLDDALHGRLAERARTRTRTRTRPTRTSNSTKRLASDKGYRYDDGDDTLHVYEDPDAAPDEKETESYSIQVHTDKQHCHSICMDRQAWDQLITWARAEPRA